MSVLATSKDDANMGHTGAELAAVLLLAYSVYRLAEMAGGVGGSLFQSQVAFMIMNGVLPLAGAVLLTIMHPGAAFGSAWAPTSPLRVQKRKAIPPPLQAQRRPEGYMTHHRYEPNIREQISPPLNKSPTSPTSQKSPTSQRHLRNNSIGPDMPSGSPGLPAHPKAALKSSPMPSPTGTAETMATVESRHSIRPERKSSAAPKRMVEKDTLW